MMRKSFATLTALTALTTGVLAGDSFVKDFDAMHKSNLERTNKDIAAMRDAESRLDQQIDHLNSDKPAGDFASSSGNTVKNAAENAISLGMSGPVTSGNARNATDKAIGVVKDMRDTVQKRDEFINGPERQRELISERQKVQEKREAAERDLAKQNVFYATNRPALVAKEKAMQERALQEKVAQEKAATERQRAADRQAIPNREHSPDGGGGSRGIDFKTIDRGLIDKGMNRMDNLGGRQPS